MCWGRRCGCGGGSWLLAPGHSRDEEFCPLLSQSGSLGRAAGGNTSKVQRSDLSQGLKWDQIVGEPRARRPTGSAGVGSLTEMLHLIPIFNHRDNIWQRIPGQGGVGVAVYEVGRAPPRFQRIFIVRFTLLRPAVSLQPHPGGSVCARGAAPPSAPRTVPVGCSPPVIPLTRLVSLQPPNLCLSRTPEPVSRVHARKNQRQWAKVGVCC